MDQLDHSMANIAISNPKKNVLDKEPSLYQEKHSKAVTKIQRAWRRYIVGLNLPGLRPTVLDSLLST